MPSLASDRLKWLSPNFTKEMEDKEILIFVLLNYFLYIFNSIIVRYISFSLTSSWLSRPGSEEEGNMGLSSQTHGTVLLTVSIALKFQSKSEVSQIKEIGIEFNETEGSPVLKSTTSIWLLLVWGGRRKRGQTLARMIFALF